MKKLLTLFLLLLPTLLFGNGGPVYVGSSVTGTGNPRFLHVKEVELLSEVLYFQLRNDYTRVSVTYLLANQSDKVLSGIEYGFPVDYFVNEGYEEEPQSTLRWRDDYTFDFHFTYNGKPLTVSTRDEQVEMQERELPESLYWHGSLLGRSAEDDHRRRWFFTTLDMAPGQIVRLEVDYVIKNGFFDYGDVSHDRQLLYDLSPASHWGDGAVRDLQIVIDASELIAHGGYVRQLIAPEFYRTLEETSGNPIEIGPEGVYRYHDTDFSLADAQPIYYAYTSDRWDFFLTRIGPDKYTMKVSSEQQAYPAKNLQDLDFSNAWVPAKRDTEPWIEYTFREPMLVGGFFMSPGYLKSEKTYTENNRVRVMRIEVEYEDGTVVTEEFGGLEDCDYCDFTDHPYSPVNFWWPGYRPYENSGPHVVFDFEYIFDYDSIRRIRFTITGVWPGSKYDDTCISEIFLFAW